MSLIFMDGFDHYVTLDIPDKGYTYAWGALHANYARFTGQGLTISNSAGYLKKDIGINKTTLYCGVAFKKNEVGTPIYNAAIPLIEFFDESSVSQVKIHVTPAYAISAYRGDDALLGTSADAVLLDQTWCYIEVKVTISDTVGEIVVRINEQIVLNLTTQDTKNGSDYIRIVDWGCINSHLDVYLDDLYIDDAQFHGDCQIKTFYPDADGNSADFTRSTGSNDFECVDEAQSNEDTDYIYSETLNHKSIFGITTGVLATVKGIQVNNHCKLEAAGSRNVKAICRSNGADYQGAESPNITADYIFENEIWEDDPDDSNPWTQAKLEAAEFGLEITT